MTDLDERTENTPPDGTGSWRIRITDAEMRLDSLERARWGWIACVGAWGLSIGLWLGRLVH